MIENLQRLQCFVDEMKGTSSMNDKKDILSEYKDDTFITAILSSTYDPMIQYYVSGKNCIKMNHLGEANPNQFETTEDLFYMLENLSERVLTGHDAICVVNTLTKTYPEYEELIHCILDKNLKIRANASVINKVIPRLIRTFDVALADKYDSKHVNFETETWYASRKLDGVRCLIIVDHNGRAKAFSRQGKEFTTLGNVIKDVERTSLYNTVLDGELCLINEDGSDNFQGVMKEIRRKDHTIENPRYKIFDMVSISVFDGLSTSKPLSDRINKLNEFNDAGLFKGTLDVLTQVEVEDENHFAALNKEASDKGHEGIMIRKDVPYEGKRTKNLLKVKSFHDAEYKVIGAVNGPFRVVEDGKEKEIDVLSAITIQHKGYTVRVGSGFSLDQRKEYGLDHSKIIGKIMTVTYFEESTNQDGGLSLRFPTVKHIYDGERDS